MAHVARILNDNDVYMIAALITPLASYRALAQQVIADTRCIEVFVDAPLSLCESRDPKEMYRKALQGLTSGFTAVYAPYESPSALELHIRTCESLADDCVAAIGSLLRRRGLPSAAR